jgi:4'-phosphopantetheinyl transferase
VYWCAKESLIKIHGKKDLILAENIHIEAFELDQSGHIIGRIIVNQQETMVPLYYRVFPDFVLVFSIQG